MRDGGYVEYGIYEHAILVLVYTGQCSHLPTSTRTCAALKQAEFILSQEWLSIVAGWQTDLKDQDEFDA